ncbi:4'-phosphopantetheinyl transferase sfp [Pandoraea terrigena]|uniref:4'-phosphopantetheinyl transferase sfp n=2 Tax=Pandoraea terrigena TaxID=2508292 RepID=A0A5E4UXY7_9BURK|nr:4'-phosphopantetheinyl transferase superfamily protein [Pandoraea terrigena]VVE03390.1 4'-phosphopantetheinyl transferase sfp [Pandoraea terrigena]
MASLAREDDRARFASVRAALRERLAAELGTAPEEVVFEADAYGRPRLADGGTLDFNVSHAGRWGLLAYSRDVRVGIDIERLDAVAEPSELWDLCLHVDERRALLRWLPGTNRQDIGRQALFHRLWCLKEAAFKSLGTGLQGSLPALCLDVAAVARVVHDAGQAFDPARVPKVPSAAVAWRTGDTGLAQALGGLELRVLPAPPGYGAALAWLPRG